MKAVCLLILASATLFNMTAIQCQNIPSDSGGESPTLDEFLQRTGSQLLQSILQKAEDDERANDQFMVRTGWLEKKRQHPGKRDEEDYEEDYADFQKRQHPGKRGDYDDFFIALQRRQHPGKRTALEGQMSVPGELLNELSKRQHPGRRSTGFDKRQHPGRRELEEGPDSGADLLELDKRQHPGKRFWDATGADVSSNGGPCGLSGCSKSSLLLQLLNDMKQSRLEEKRQHPGKRLLTSDELIELD